MGIDTTVEALLAVAGGIAIIGSAGAIVWKAILPVFQVKGDIAELKRRSDADFRRLERIDEYNRAVAHALIALLNHAETGNSTGTIKAAREELQTFLIDR
jgi:hypothetical protein